MGSILDATEGKPEATIRKDWEGEQREMPLFAEVQPPKEACAVFVQQSSWPGAIRYAVQRSGYDDYEVADAMHISHGYFSRVMRGTASLSGERLVKFMRITGSVAPLQWLADQMGYELRAKKSELEQRAEAAEREAAALRAQIAVERRRA
jgi:plasmid maintenance system antidote protein VapI